jgi:hypothetical protein
MGGAVAMVAAFARGQKLDTQKFLGNFLPHQPLRFLDSPIPREVKFSEELPSLAAESSNLFHPKFVSTRSSLATFYLINLYTPRFWTLDLFLDFGLFLDFFSRQTYSMDDAVAMAGKN